MKYSKILFALLFSLSTSLAYSQSVEFIEPKDGDTVGTSFIAKFKVTGMTVSPAGEAKPGTGHHHLLINAADFAENAIIPFDNQHKHFGKGQTETEVVLPPGKYKLTLQFANGEHKSYGEKLRKTIEITVK